MERIPASAALRIPLKLYLSSDHISDATGKTLAITISKNGGAFGNPSGGATNATEIANGWYYYDASTTDTGTVGPLIVRGTSASCDDCGVAYDVVAATNGGWTALPATACTTNASLLTSGTGTAQITAASGQVTVATNNDKTGYTASTVSDKTGYALTAGERNSTADALLDRAAGIETGLTLRQALRLIAAACSGLATGLAGTTATYKSADISAGSVQGTTSRIIATVDADGNRTAITVDLT